MSGGNICPRVIKLEHHTGAHGTSVALFMVELDPYPPQWLVVELSAPGPLCLLTKEKSVAESRAAAWAARLEGD